MKLAALVTCVLLAFSITAVAYFEKTPYLIYPGDPEEMWILWQGRDSSSFRFEFGTTASYEILDVESLPYGDRQHIVKLEALQEDALYYYRVSDTDDVKEGTFRSALPLSADSVRFLGIADTQYSRCGTAKGITNALDDYLASPNAPRTFCLLAGDWIIIDGCAYSDFWSDNKRIEVQWEAFHHEWRNILASIPIQGCLGNHDVADSGTDVQDLRPIHLKYWPYPYEDRGCWSFDYGPVHVVVLDQFSDMSEGSPQYEWLRSDLADAQHRPWTIAQFHMPVDAEAPSVKIDSRSRFSSEEMYAPIWPLFVQYGVDLTVSGHSHCHDFNYLDGVPMLVMAAASHSEADAGWFGSPGCQEMYYEYSVVENTMTIIVYLPTGEVFEELQIDNR